MIDGRRTDACRSMWRRWWMGMPVDHRDMTVVDLCTLPRGSGSDQGWLRYR